MGGIIRPRSDYRELALLSHEQLAHCRLLVAGDVMLDRYWFGEVERISSEAPVPVVRVRTCEEGLGGAANVARNMTSLGAHAALLGVVGQDEARFALDRLLKEAGITAHLEFDASLATTVKLRIIGQQQQVVRADFESRPDGDVLLAMRSLRAYFQSMSRRPVGLRQRRAHAYHAHDRSGTYCGSTGACRSQGGRVLALGRCQRYNSKAQRAA